MLQGFFEDISSWNTFSVRINDNMFFKSEIAKKLGIKRPSLDQVKSHFLSLKLEADLQGASPRQSGIGKIRL